MLWFYVATYARVGLRLSSERNIYDIQKWKRICKPRRAPYIFANLGELCPQTVQITWNILTHCYGHCQSYGGHRTQVNQILSHVRNWVRLENERPKFGFLFPKTWSPKTVYLWVILQCRCNLSANIRNETQYRQKEKDFFTMIGLLHCRKIRRTTVDKHAWGVAAVRLQQYCPALMCVVFTAVLWWEFCPSVCPSVRLSVTRVIPDKTVKRSVQIFIPYERTFILVFWEEEWLVGGDPYYVKFWVNRHPLERNRRFSTNNRS